MSANKYPCIFSHQMAIVYTFSRQMEVIVYTMRVSSEKTGPTSTLFLFNNIFEASELCTFHCLLLYGSDTRVVRMVDKIDVGIV